MLWPYTCSLNGIYHPQWLVQWSCYCSRMCIPAHSPWLPGDIHVAQTMLIVLTMAGLFLARPLYISPGKLRKEALDGAYHEQGLAQAVGRKGRAHPSYANPKYDNIWCLQKMTRSSKRLRNRVWGAHDRSVARTQNSSWGVLANIYSLQESLALSFCPSPISAQLHQINFHIWLCSHKYFSISKFTWNPTCSWCCQGTRIPGKDML